MGKRTGTWTGEDARRIYMRLRPDGSLELIPRPKDEPTSNYGRVTKIDRKRKTITFEVD